MHSISMNDLVISVTQLHELPFPNVSTLVLILTMNGKQSVTQISVSSHSVLFLQLAKQLPPKHRALYPQRFHMADIRLTTGTPLMCYRLQKEGEHVCFCMLRHRRGSEESKENRRKVLFKGMTYEECCTRSFFHAKKTREGAK